MRDSERRVGVLYHHGAQERFLDLGTGERCNLFPPGTVPGAEQVVLRPLGDGRVELSPTGTSTGYTSSFGKGWDQVFGQQEPAEA